MTSSVWWGTSSYLDLHPNVVAFSPHQIGVGAAAVSAEVQRDARAADAQAIEIERADEVGQLRVGDRQRALRGVGLKAEARLQEEKQRARGPRLRRAGDRIVNQKSAASRIGWSAQAT